MSSFLIIECQLSCSGHGSCDKQTKRCRCDVFWMENPFSAHIGRHESNCGEFCTWRHCYTRATAVNYTIMLSLHACYYHSRVECVLRGTAGVGCPVSYRGNHVAHVLVLSQKVRQLIQILPPFLPPYHYACMRVYPSFLLPPSLPPSLPRRNISRSKRRIRYAIHDHGEVGESKRMLTKGQQYIELKG